MAVHNGVDVSSILQENKALVSCESLIRPKKTND